MRRILMGLGLLLTGSVMLLHPAAYGREPEMNGTGKSKIHITADRLVSRQAGRYAEFSGNVRATQADTVIVSDMLTIYFNAGEGLPSDSAGNADSIEKLVAVGNVVIDHENMRATCEEAIYTSSDGLLVLLGQNVLVKDEAGSITGEKVVFNRETGEITVTGETGSRVEAVFQGTGESGMLPDAIQRPGDR